MYPVWLRSGKDVIYVYMDGDEKKMETYEMNGDRSVYRGTQICDHDLSNTEPLEGPWLAEMKKRRMRRLQGFGKLGQPKLF